MWCTRKKVKYGHVCCCSSRMSIQSPHPPLLSSLCSSVLLRIWHLAKQVPLQQDVRRHPRPPELLGLGKIQQGHWGKHHFRVPGRYQAGSSTYSLMALKPNQVYGIFKKLVDPSQHLLNFKLGHWNQPSPTLEKV